MKTTFLLALAISSAAYSQANFAGPINDNYTKGDTLTAAKLENIKTAVNDNDARSLPDGVTPGDVLYWNGSVWNLTPASIACSGDSANLKLTNGVPTWTCSDVMYVIGDTGPAGGKVFHITDGGLHGLEAASVDQASSTWGCDTTLIAGANGLAVGTGAQNTADIIFSCATASAASVAASYGPGWFLPSKDELNLLYTQKGVVGGFASDVYWSSSQVSSGIAWGQFFLNGFQNYFNKTDTVRVRAVRAF